MKTDNELIAEFMGEEIGGVVANTNEKIKVFINPKNKGRQILAQYDSSWYWLMPVVEKIESLEFVFIIDGVQANIMSDEDPDKGLILKEYSTKIESVYFACVEFIKWYNENIK